MYLNTVEMRIYPILAVLSVVAMVASAELNYLCHASSINNGSTVSTTSLSNYVDACTMNWVTFDAPVMSLLQVYKSEVGPGGLVKFVFGPVLYSITVSFVRFHRDARLSMEGTLQSGAAIDISNLQFDIRNPFDGDVIPIDLRGISVLLMYTSISLFNISANIESSQVIEGLAAAVALTPSSVENSNLKILACRFTMNISMAASLYGVFVSTSGSTSMKILISSNDINLISTLGNSTAFSLLLTMGNSLIQRLFNFEYNKANGFSTFLQATTDAPNVVIRSNTHTHFAPSICNVKVTYPEDMASLLTFEYNVFRTVFDPSNPYSSKGNPVLIISLDRIAQQSTVTLRENEVHASSFATTPILFPGSTNLLEDSSVYVYSNYFTTNSLSATLVPMTSFAISPFAPSRTVDLGTVYLCSNVWPPVFSAATTTTVTQSTTTPVATTALVTRTAVAPADALDEVVASTDRPLNVSMAGGQCPVFIGTRTPVNGALSPATTSALLIVVACMAITL